MLPLLPLGEDGGERFSISLSITVAQQYYAFLAKVSA